jgi:hypothetical protein
MPNHCSNDLRIQGNPKDIEAFFAAVKGEEILDSSYTENYCGQRGG